MQVYIFFGNYGLKKQVIFALMQIRWHKKRG